MRPHYRIGILTHIDSAHYLIGTGTKCDNLHGHRWEIEVSVSSPTLTEKGWVMDFSTLKSLLEEITSQLDHKLLNDFLPQPTAENLAFYILQKLKEKLPENLKDSLIVRVYESPDSWVEVKQ